MSVWCVLAEWKIKSNSNLLYGSVNGNNHKKMSPLQEKSWKTLHFYLKYVVVWLSHLDLTDSSSFKRARFWVKELQNCEEVKYTHVSQQQERLKIIQQFTDALF